jgi:hypothetical protein
MKTENPSFGDSYLSANGFQPERVNGPIEEENHGLRRPMRMDWSDLWANQLFCGSDNFPVNA